MHRDGSVYSMKICRDFHSRTNASAGIKYKKEMDNQMRKIAAITDDGKTISLHFGRAQYYMVVTVEGGQIVHREMRDKINHAQLQAEGEDHDDAGGRHGYGPVADQRHGRMAQTIADCEAVLCRGMGMGAYENMQARKIRPVVTDITGIDEAVMVFVNGEMVDHIEKLH